MSLTTEEYERLRRPLLQMLAEAQAQYQRNIEPIRAQLTRLASIYAPSPVMIMDMSQIDPAVLAELAKNKWGDIIPYPAPPIPVRVTDLPDPPHSKKCVTCMTDDELGTVVAREPLGPPFGLSQEELACAGPELGCGGYSDSGPNV